MAKLKTRYTCQACGSDTHRWQGQCPDCGEWNTLVQESATVTVFSAKHNLQGGGRAIDYAPFHWEIGTAGPTALAVRAGRAEVDETSTRVPEPSTLAVIAVGAGFAWSRRRRRMRTPSGT